jgi:hypothetical protein
MNRCFLRSAKSWSAQRRKCEMCPWQNNSSTMKFELFHLSFFRRDVNMGRKLNCEIRMRAICRWSIHVLRRTPLFKETDNWRSHCTDHLQSFWLILVCLHRTQADESISLYSDNVRFSGLNCKPLDNTDVSMINDLTPSRCSIFLHRDSLVWPLITRWCEWPDWLYQIEKFTCITVSNIPHPPHMIICLFSYLFHWRWQLFDASPRLKVFPCQTINLKRQNSPPNPPPLEQNSPL